MKKYHTEKDSLEHKKNKKPKYNPKDDPSRKNKKFYMKNTYEYI